MLRYCLCGWSPVRSMVVAENASNRMGVHDLRRGCSRPVLAGGCKVLDFYITS